ncbi:DNA-processing protein DprA [Hydrogenimonas sp.]
MSLVEFEIPELTGMKKPPRELHYAGNPRLLRRPKISIVGSRRPGRYASMMTHRIAGALARRGVTIVSGAAMGIDAAAHRGAGAERTIAVLPCGIDLRYPALNAKLIDDIAQKGLLLSQFAPDFRAAPWSFVVRNELVVALGDALVVAEADLQSGSMRSVEFARRMGKRIYVLPHRLGESEGTNALLAEGSAEAIFDPEAFAETFSPECGAEEDPLLSFCAMHPTYDEALAKFGERLYEAELEGKISVRDGRVMPT